MELAKVRLGKGDDLSCQAARSTLVTVLDGILRLLHPIMPFVTSELWSQLPTPQDTEKPETLAIADWPQARQDLVDEKAVIDLNQIQELVTQIRSLRKEYGVGVKTMVDLQLIGARTRLFELLIVRPEILDKMAGVGKIQLNTVTKSSGANAVLKDGTEVIIPLEGVIDLAKESEKLNAEILRLNRLVEGVRKKLSNEKFLSAAPTEVVEREKLKEDSFLQQLSALSKKRRNLSGI